MKWLFFFIVFLCSSLSAQKNDVSIFNSEQSYKYAKSLLQKKDYYRSITEFKRYIFFGKNKKKREKAQFYIGLNYLQAKNFKNAREYFYNISDDPSHSQRELSLLKIADSYFYEETDQIKEMKTYYFYPLQFSTDYYIRYLNEYKNDYSYYKEAYIKLIKINILNLNQYRSFYLINNSQIKNKKYKPLLNKLNKKVKVIDDISQKSKVLSTIFSVIIPGTGQMYAGEIKQGFIALGINLAFGLSAYYTYVNYSKLLGIFIGYYELTFYFGNINNAQLAVEKYNENQKNLFRQEVLRITF